MIVKDFQYIGDKLFSSSLNNSHSGNLSIRLANKMYITRSGSQLGNLLYNDIVEISVFNGDIKNASRESIVHRSIYNNTEAKAIVHSHPPFITALSILIDKFKPIDAEGKYYFEEIPVLKTENAIGSDEVSEKIPSYFNKCPIVIVSGHGSFAIGKNLEEGYQATSSVENSAKILYYNLVYKQNYKNL